MKSIINLELISSLRPNIRIVVGNVPTFFNVGDIESVSHEIDQVVVNILGVEDKQYLASSKDCYIPYVTHGNIKYYLSLAWRAHLKYEDIGSEVHFEVGNSGTNENKAIRIKGYCTIDNSYHAIPWSNLTHKEDVERLKIHGEINNLTFFS